MKVFITGTEGFVGQHLFTSLYNNNIDVSGSVYIYDREDMFFKKHSKNLFKIDITKRKEIIGHIKNINPDFVIHLAAISFVPDASRDPLNVILTNIYGTQNIISAIEQLNKPCHTIFASSAEVYGPPEDNIVITEESPINPQSLYAITKLTGEYLFLQSGLPVTVLRLFNHTGIGQRSDFVIPNFAGQIVEIEKSSKNELMVGNLNGYKDFMDVRDVVDAYISVIRKPASGIYNVCSGNSFKLSDLVQIMMDYSSKPITITIDKNRYRNASGAKFTASNKKFSNSFIWQPKINIYDTIRNLIDYYRNKEDIS